MGERRSVSAAQRRSLDPVRCGGVEGKIRLPNGLEVKKETSKSPDRFLCDGSLGKIPVGPRFGEGNWRLRFGLRREAPARSVAEGRSRARNAPRRTDHASGGRPAPYTGIPPGARGPDA